MTRTGCFEISTSCGKCEQPVPVNGPVRSLTCSHCFGAVTIPAERYGSLFEDFNEEYAELSERQGRGGTVMAGSGTYKYGYWRMTPRCGSCEASLPEVADGFDGEVACTECGERHAAYPAPEWLKKVAPSATQCIGGEREAAAGDAAAAQVDNAAVKPVVMQCPQCGGALSVGAASERILTCQYCQADVFVPDPIWLALHPVETKKEWFVRFQGRTRKQLAAEQREEDEQAERAELRRWKPRVTRKPSRRATWIVVIGLLALLALVVLGTAAAAGVMFALGFPWGRIGEILLPVFGGALFVCVMAAALQASLRGTLAFRFGAAGKSKRAMTALAERHGWEHLGAEHAGYMGRIRGSIGGRDVEVDPDDDHALEVELNGPELYLDTEPPGQAPDDHRRFTTGDPRFDGWFPIRYASVAMVDRMEAGEDVLAPLNWFLDRWAGRLGRMVVNYSRVGIHLSPYHLERSGSLPRFLLADELEPLLEDSLVLARALDAVARGRDPELPG